MRISLTKKILLIYCLLISFSFVQGMLIIYSIKQFQTHNKDLQLVEKFKYQIHKLEELKTYTTFDIHQDHITFQNEYQQAADILEIMTELHHVVIDNHLTQLNEAKNYLNNYRRAYLELDSLTHKTYDFHSQGVESFSEINSHLSSLEPALLGKLYSLLLNHHIMVEAALYGQDISLLPELKELHSTITNLTSDKLILSHVQKIVQLTEKNYLNSLAVLDRKEFLDESAAHLIRFCDTITISLRKHIVHYNDLLQLFMHCLLATALVLTMFMFWTTRRYFIKFLQSQQNAITAIGNNEYDYPLRDLPKDELGDLAIFMKNMASNLEKSRNEIQKSEEQIRLLLNSAAEAIYGLDLDGRCTFCNDSFLKLTGFESEDEIIGKNVHDLIHHTRKDGNEYPWDECVGHRGFLEGKQTHSDNEIYWRKDGSRFYAECWSHPIKRDGKTIGAVVTFLDITERREALQALRNSEELYRSLVENIELGITLIDKDHTVIMTNPAQGKMFNRDALSFKGKKCFREFERRDEICSHCPGIVAMETGNVHETFAAGIKDDGSSFTVRIKAFPVYKEKDKPSGFIEVVEDVSDKLKAEQDLAAEKEQLSVTLRSIGDGVITTDVEGRVVLVNKVAEKLCGWSQTEAQGRHLTEIFQIINEITGEPCENPVNKVLETGHTVELANHTALISRDGTQRSIADSGAAIRDRNSEIIGVVLVFRDVTEEYIKEKELLKAQKLESIGVLAGGIAHDFNNILSAILGNINLVRHILKPDEDKAHLYLEEAEKASVRAQNLTQQLLTFSKGGEPVKQTASLNEIISDSTAFVLRGTDIKYKYFFPEDLWAVEVDPGQISQVIQNIILNARHAMPNGGAIQINCQNIPPEGEKPAVLSKGRKFVKVSIEDAGIGIPAKIIDNIFDPYFTTKTDGSGLGLSICHSIIDKHRGHISVQSKQGIGTTFTLYLPASEESPVKEEAPHHERLYDQENLKILVMDDDEQIRTIAVAMLEHLGCETLEAVDGEEAVKLYRSSLEAGKPIDLMIMDLTIPGGMGGQEAFAEILKLDPEAKAIVSSGYSNDPVMASFKEYRFKGAVIKPYQLEELAKAIYDALAE